MDAASQPLTAAGDEYTQRTGQAEAPPSTVADTLRYLGPSVIITATIVGSGEIILTASLGAAVGYSMLWWVLFSCWSKSILQAELARYIVLSGDTYLRMLNRIPGKIPGPKQPFSWPIGLGLIGFATGITALGGLIGGAGLAVSLVLPELPTIYAVAGLAVLTAALLWTGKYNRLQSIMLVFVVSFTLITVTSALLMQDTDYATTAADIISGFTFEWHVSFAVIALAAYGFTGVNAGEIAAYTYWCIEKGYPARIGPFEDTPAWYERAHGWLKVLRTDVWFTLVILTCATIPFYFLGAGVLHSIGETPEGTETVRRLSAMFTEVLGAWSLILFAIGAFCILYSSTVAAVAAGGRYIPDYLIELGFMSRERVDLRHKIIRWYGLIVPFIGLGMYWGFQNPVLMVTIGACFAAFMLPIQSGITIYLQKKRLPEAVQPHWPAKYLLRILFVVQAVLAALVIYFPILGD